MRARNNKIYVAEAASLAVVQIKIEDIRPNPAQPRIEFDTNSIIRLADSIRRYGVLQPLSVRISSDANYKYELIAGERRLRAIRSLGYHYAPCMIVEANERLSAELAIIENLLREDLNMFEEAFAFRQLIDNYSLTQEEIARKVSLSQSAVANKLRLLKLSYDEQRKIIDFDLTERHARALLRISDPSLRSEALEHIAKHKLTVAASEQYVDRLLLSYDRCEDNKACESGILVVERAKNDIISTLNKKIDAIKRSGCDVMAEVVELDGSIEVVIKFPQKEEMEYIIA